MKIEKVFNNNVVQILGINNEEIIVMGKGLGFQKKSGDEVNQDLIEKRFILQNTDTDMVGELSRVYVDLDSEEIDLVLEIIHQGQEKLGQTFDISLYIALADHLHYTIQRTREGLTLQNPLAWEVRKFYPEEFQLGKDTIELVKEKMTLQLADDEAASIALHFINAQKDGGLLEKNRLISKIVSDILELFVCILGRLEMKNQSVIIGLSPMFNTLLNVWLMVLFKEKMTLFFMNRSKKIILMPLLAQKKLNLM